MEHKEYRDLLEEALEGWEGVRHGFIHGRRDLDATLEAALESAFAPTTRMDLRFDRNQACPFGQESRRDSLRGLGMSTDQLVTPGLYGLHDWSVLQPTRQLCAHATANEFTWLQRLPPGYPRTRWGRKLPP